MLRKEIQGLLSNTDLNRSKMAEIADAVLLNKNPIQTAAFLALLKSKGESVDEIVGFASAILERCISVHLPVPCIDIVGTGGDGSQSVNISTGAAILTAGCGIPLAKHGNRAVSSKSGSADVLEALGIAVDLDPLQISQSIKKVGIGFIFAQKYHPSLKTIAPLRQALGIPTVFNLIGPLINPARPKFALIGVGQEKYLKVIAQSALELGVERALVFHGNGLDELTTLGPTEAISIESGQIKEMTIDPLSLGLKLCTKQDLKGGTPQENARILRETLAGKKGALADTLILNAGLALWLYGKCSTPEAGIVAAEKAHSNQLGLQVLEKWVLLSQEFRGV